MISQRDTDYMAQAVEYAQNSKDNSRKASCLFVRCGRLLCRGYNDLPQGVLDKSERRERPDKYLFTDHAESQAITYAARHGIALFNSTVYIPWHPCCTCARMLIGVG